MTATITLPIETIATSTPEPKTCPRATAAPGGDPCQHPSGSCKPEGCSAC